MKKFPCEKRAGSQRWKLRWSNKDGERERVPGFSRFWGFVFFVVVEASKRDGISSMG